MPSPGRAKYHLIAEVLEAQLTNGAWSDQSKLPGVRQVAEEHKVALATAARALEVLIGKGLVKARGRSGIYRVEAPPGRRDEIYGLCLRITPGPWQQSSMETTIQGFLDASADLGSQILTDVIPNDLERNEAALGKVVRDARRAGVSGLFLIPSRIDDAQMEQDERFLTTCRKAGMPVVLVDRNLRGDARPLELDLVHEDDLAGGLACALHLFETGRSKLAFVHGSPTSSHNERLAGFLLAHCHASWRGLIPSPAAFPPIWEYPDDPSSRRAYRILCDRILEEEVDGVVCYHDRIAIGLAIELLTRGKRIPDDVALTGFDDQAIGQEFAVGITTYAYPARAIAEEAIAVMRRRAIRRSAPPVKVVVPSSLIVRESSVAAVSQSAAYKS